MPVPSVAAAMTPAWQLRAAWQRHWRWLEAAVLIALLVALFVRRIDYVGFHPDESQWIATSRYFESLMALDFSSQAWAEGLWTLTQPPLARYVIAIGRSLGGYDASELNLAWRFAADFDTNVAEGRLPEPRLLQWSRTGPAVLAAGSALLFFNIASALAGRLAGYVSLALFVINPYFALVLCRAMGDSPLAFFTLLSIVAAGRWLAHWPPPREPQASGKLSPASYAWLVAMGVCAGLAGASKLNGLTGALGGCLLVAVVAARPGAFSSRPDRVAFVLTGVAVVGVAAMVAFLVVNPFVYPDPLGRTLQLVEHRTTSLDRQFLSFTDDQITPANWLQVVPPRILADYAALRGGPAPAANLILVVSGLAALLRQSWRWWQAGSAPGMAVAVAVVGFSHSTPSLLTPLDWERYYLMPVLFSTLVIGLSIAAGLAWVGGRATWLRAGPARSAG